MDRLGIDCHEREVYTHKSLETEACTPCTRAIRGIPRASQEAERIGRKCRQKPLFWFLREETGEAGLRALGLAHLNDSSGLWAVGAI